MLVLEGMLVASTGAGAGIILAIGWAALMMFALRTFWVGAVGTTLLELHVDPLALATGAVGALVAALLSIAVTMRGLSRASPRAMLAGTGVIWAAVYMLWMLQRVVFGTKTSEENAALPDLNLREAILILPLIILMFFMGVYPQPFLNRSRDSIEAARQRIAGPQEAGPAHIAQK